MKRNRIYYIENEKNVNVSIYVRIIIIIISKDIYLF